MKKLIYLLPITLLFFNACATVNFGGSGSTSATVTSQADEGKTDIDKKVAEIKRNNRSSLLQNAVGGL